MKSYLSIFDVKEAVWDKKFRELFPEYKDAFEKFLKSPKCACNLGLIKNLMAHKDRMHTYFPNKEIPEEIEAKNDWGVINCPVAELEDRLRSLDKTKRMVTAARFKDRITVITNDVTALYISSKNIEEQKSKPNEMNWQVINTNTKELINELRKLSGRKVINISRFKNQITVIVNNAELLF